MKTILSQYLQTPQTAAFHCRLEERANYCKWRPLEQRKVPRDPCIYQLRHIPTGLSYVGRTKNFRVRAASHRNRPYQISLTLAEMGCISFRLRDAGRGHPDLHENVEVRILELYPYLGHGAVYEQVYPFLLDAEREWFHYLQPEINRHPVPSCSSKRRILTDECLPRWPSWLYRKECIDG